MRKAFYQTSNKIAAAETIFYKNSNSGLSSEEHNLAYKVKLERQFPMNLAHGSKIPYNLNEIAAINKDIHKKLPTIYAAPIPKTLYELFAKRYIEKMNVKYYPGEYQYTYNNMGKDTILCQFYNNNLEKLHGDINNYIISELAEKNISQLTQNDCEDILEQKPYLIEKKLKYPLKKAINLEYNAHENGNFFLYRATEMLPPHYLFTIPHTNYSFSFGSSLFGGYFYDSGACAYKLFEDRKSGYVVPINKKKYMRKSSSLQNMFHIPGLTPLAQMFGLGELFHSRSKLKNRKNLGLKAGFCLKPEYTPDSVIIQGSKSTKNKTYHDIFNFIAKNHIPITKATFSSSDPHTSV